ncbi:hypothetical protein BH20ACT5_BH20ACT5_19640 [soil metagenome]
MPEYVPRLADKTLREAVAAALTGHKGGFVVVVGRSKVGKSRTLFEALRQSAPAGELLFVAPVNGDALRSLLGPGQRVHRQAAKAVLWLDDLEPFVNQGVTIQTLREWHADCPGRIVAGTYGGKGSELIAGSAASGLLSIASDVLQHACEIPLEETTVDELHALRSRLSAAEFAAVDRHGLAAYLVAGPSLERKLITGRHAPGEEACPEGLAVVYAAIDWARCGRTDSIDEQTLRQLWPVYLRHDVAVTETGFNVGTEWALRPVAGTIALLQRTRSYEAFDYVVRLVRDKPGTSPPRDSSWSAAASTAVGAQAFAVGLAAYEHSRFDDALTAFARARESSTDELAATAGHNLGARAAGPVRGGGRGLRPGGGPVRHRPGARAPQNSRLGDPCAQEDWWGYSDLNRRRDRLHGHSYPGRHRCRLSG